jgi:hypothetical protein
MAKKLTNIVSNLSDRKMYYRRALQRGEILLPPDDIRYEFTIEENDNMLEKMQGLHSQYKKKSFDTSMERTFLEDAEVGLSDLSERSTYLKKQLENISNLTPSEISNDQSVWKRYVSFMGVMEHTCKQMDFYLHL